MYFLSQVLLPRKPKCDKHCKPSDDFIIFADLSNNVSKHPVFGGIMTMIFDF